MIELTQLNGTVFVLNCNLIESIENIPETKVSLTNGKYFLVQENRQDIVKRVIQYKQMVFQNVFNAFKL